MFLPFEIILILVLINVLLLTQLRSLPLDMRVEDDDENT